MTRGRQEAQYCAARKEVIISSTISPLRVDGVSVL